MRAKIAAREAEQGELVKQLNRQAWPKNIALTLIVAVGLSGCDKLEMPKFNFGKKDSGSVKSAPANQTTTKLVERDVEAPDVFQVTDNALWDGRPSLGGVWVAYPGDIQPERVIIRNEGTGKFVIGALFKRERENPGPKIQLSSDAAAALGILAGKPTSLNVTALRREAVPEPTTPAPEKPAAKKPKKKPAAKSVTEIATAALDRAEGKTAPTPKAKPTPAAKPKPASKPASSLSKPFIQIGIFSVEKNARNTATSLSTQSILPIVKAQKSHGKKFWRVLVGPASDKAERARLLKKARELGFNDAYFVTN